MTIALLEVKDLRVHYRLGERTVFAVDGIAFDVQEGEYFGIVGESGCGKSTVAKALLQILPATAKIPTGEIRLEGRDLLAVSEAEMRGVRWKRISMITQSALNALDPVATVGHQVAEAIRLHQRVDNREARRRTHALFELVGLDPERDRNFPHQFSGGMRQRVIIAMALALNPSIVIADEPTTALDLVVQDQIFAKIRELHGDGNHSMILITHDISLIAENCDRVAVMYGGRIMEVADALSIFSKACHPYTLGLQNAVPLVRGPKKSLISIPGNPPSLDTPIRGCPFADRCPFATDRCRQEKPEPQAFSPGHFVACHYPEKSQEFRERAIQVETWRRMEAH